MFVNGLVRLTRDSELTFTKSGTALLKMGLAYDLGFGENKKSCFIDAVLWGKQGESAKDYLKKGTQISIESGELVFDEWKKDGQKRSKHSVKIVNFKFAGGKQEGGYKKPDFEDDLPF